MTLELHATPQEVMRAVECLQELGREKRLGQRDLFATALMLEECASNIVAHAYQGDARQKLRVSFEFTPAAVTLELRDHGPQFDPTQELPRSDTTNRDYHGGRGLILVRHYTDEMLYRREAGENVLRLTKRLSARPPVPESINTLPDRLT